MDTSNPEKTMKVVFTKNLGMFKFHEVNRETDKKDSAAKILRIKNSMINDGLLRHAIIVTSKFYVVDGQHRLLAATQAGKGIWFLVDESIPNTAKGIFEAAKKLNRDAKEWQKKDYLHGYSIQGNTSYTVLTDFIKKYPMFSLTECIMFLMNSTGKGTGMRRREFADGLFVANNVNLAEKWADYLLELKPYFEKGYNKSQFVRTIITLLEKKKKFDFKEFLHKVKMRPTCLKLCGDTRAYSELIEEIYNYRRPNDSKVPLRFL
jgi:hypothetical protein